MVGVEGDILAVARRQRLAAVGDQTAQPFRADQIGMHERVAGEVLVPFLAAETAVLDRRQGLGLRGDPGLGHDVREQFALLAQKFGFRVGDFLRIAQEGIEQVGEGGQAALRHVEGASAVACMG